MALSPKLKKRLIAAAGSGAFIIATHLLQGEEGLEGRIYRPYRDVAGIWTVCDGHTGSGIVPGKIYTDQQCDSLLRDDLKPVEQAVDGLVKVPLNEYQRAALYSFTFNVGITAFRQSTLLRELNAGHYQNACDQMRRWVYAGGKKWRGLINRRETERSVCLLEDGNELAER